MAAPMVNGGWAPVAPFLVPVIMFALGPVGARYLAVRPRLVFYLAHGASTAVRNRNGGQPILLNTHSVVKNMGWQSATNVRVAHAAVADFSVWPMVPYQSSDRLGGVFEILFPKLAPGEWATITYVCAPPLTTPQFATSVRSDEQMGKQVNVIPAIKPPIWVLVITGALQAVGLAALLYWEWGRSDTCDDLPPSGRRSPICSTAASRRAVGGRRRPARDSQARGPGESGEASSSRPRSCG